MLTQNYTGIDYSKGMIKACRKKFKSLEFIHCDAGNMNIFNDNSFDFVLFTFNGIDCMSHEKRIKILKEIYRVLNFNGVFVFSSHNLDDRKHIRAFNRFDINIYNNLKNFISYMKVRKHEIQKKNHAIYSDPLGGFGTLTYFIRKADQVVQLKRCGFSDVKILDCECRFVEPDSIQKDGKWFWYICKKQK